jgi:hypothetical protein
VIVSDHQRQLEVEGDNYKHTVLALCAFANEILFDDNARTVRQSGSVHCGRRMRTSEANRRSKDTDVTPDLVVCQSETYGVIAEAKFGFDADAARFSDRVQKTAEQLEKYDDDLDGWPGQKPADGRDLSHDVVLLVNHEDAKRVARQLKAIQNAGGFTITRKFAIVSFMLIVRARGAWPELDLEEGALSNAEKTSKLENGLLIHPEVLARNPHIAHVELSDVAPPLPIMMDLVHKAIVTRLTQDENEQYNVEGSVEKSVSKAQLHKWLSVYAFPKCDSRDPVIPRPDWVAKAVTALVAMGWAERKLGEKESFLYHHRKGRKNYNNPYGRFVAFSAKKSAEADERASKKMEREESRRTRRRETDKRKMPLLADQIDRDEVGTGGE